MSEYTAVDDVLWRALLANGRNWSPLRTVEFVNAARNVHELLLPRPTDSVLPEASEERGG